MYARTPRHRPHSDLLVTLDQQLTAEAFTASDERWRQIDRARNRAAAILVAALDPADE
jgi:hypothetical protein